MQKGTSIWWSTVSQATSFWKTTSTNVEASNIANL